MYESTKTPSSLELFHASFLINVTLPVDQIDLNPTDFMFGLIHEHEGELQSQLEARVGAQLGQSFELSKMFSRRGSVEIYLVVGGTYGAITNYRNLREGIQYLVADFQGLIRRFSETLIQREVPFSPDEISVVSSWTPSEGLLQSEFDRREDERPKGLKNRRSGGWRLQRWVSAYLALMNAILVGFLIWLVIDNVN